MAVARHARLRGCFRGRDGLGGLWFLQPLGIRNGLGHGGAVLAEDGAVGADLGEDIVGCLEMAFGSLEQDLGFVLSYKINRGIFHSLGRALRKLESIFLSHLEERAEEMFPGEDGSGGDGEVGFGAVLLDELDLFSFLHERLLDLFLAAELVGDGARAGGDDGEKVFDCPRVCPGEQGVDAPHLEIEPVIGGGSDPDDGELVAEEFPQVAAHVHGLAIAGDGFAVADVHLAHFLGEGLVDVGAGDD